MFTNKQNETSTDDLQNIPNDNKRKTDVKAVVGLLKGDKEHYSRDVRDVVALPPDGGRYHGQHKHLPQVNSVEHLEDTCTL